MEYVYVVYGNCCMSGGYPNTYEEPYVVTFGVYSTLEKALEGAYENHDDDRLGYYNSNECPLYIVKTPVDHDGERLVITIMAWPEDWTLE